MSARQALGKGLGALIPDKPLAEGERKKSFFTCGIEEIQPNPFQPRKTFPDEPLQELVQSIREKGILQPLVVRRKGDRYELIAGERRWRAAQKAGIKEVPILVKDVLESELLELSLIENIQRENLNPIEEAEAYKGLAEQFRLTQEDISQKVGRDRATVANALRLLKLPPEIKQSLAEGKVSVGHARALLGLDSPEKQRTAWRKILAGGLSVRQTENLIRRLRPKNPTASLKNAPEWDPLVEELQRSLGTRVRIVGRKKRGRIEIDFFSLEELERILDFFRR